MDPGGVGAAGPEKDAVEGVGGERPWLLEPCERRSASCDAGSQNRTGCCFLQGGQFYLETFDVDAKNGGEEVDAHEVIDDECDGGKGDELADHLDRDQAQENCRKRELNEKCERRREADGGEADRDSLGYGEVDVGPADGCRGGRVRVRPNA